MLAIKTSRIVIRNFVINDWKDLQEIFINFKSSEYAIYDHHFPNSDDEVKEITERFANGNKFFAVCLLTHNKVMGYVCLNGEDDKELDIGYCFNDDYQGSGYATEACIAVTNYAFNTLHLERLTAGTAILNIPSCNLLDRLGFCKTSESNHSFAKTPEGNPIEFIGASFLLEKANWMKKDYSHIK